MNGTASASPTSPNTSGSRVIWYSAQAMATDCACTAIITSSPSADSALNSPMRRAAKASVRTRPDRLKR